MSVVRLLAAGLALALAGCGAGAPVEPAIERPPSAERAAVVPDAPSEGEAPDAAPIDEATSSSASPSRGAPTTASCSRAEPSLEYSDAEMVNSSSGIAEPNRLKQRMNVRVTGPSTSA